jgi:prepilin-type N-terminal cleavage/methylation domain-containing protein
MTNFPARNRYAQALAGRPARTKRSNALKGFTLIELLIVIAIIGIITFPLLLTYRSYRTSQALNSSVEQVANNVRAVHVFAREARNQREWGIKNLNDSMYALYSSGATGDVDEQQYSLASGVLFPEDFNVLFEIGSGDTDRDYSIPIENVNGKRINVDVSTEGVVEVRIE